MSGRQPWGRVVEPAYVECQLTLQGIEFIFSLSISDLLPEGKPKLEQNFPTHMLWK